MVSERVPPCDRAPAWGVWEPGRRRQRAQSGCGALDATGLARRRAVPLLTGAGGGRQRVLEGAGWWLACLLMAQFRGLSLNSVTPNLFSSISQLNPGLCLLPASRSCCSCEVPWTETGSRHQPGHPTVGHSSGCGAPAPQPQARTINRTAKQTA